MEYQLVILGEKLGGERVSRCDKGQFLALQLQRASLWKGQHIRLPHELYIAGDAGFRSQLRKGIEVVGHGAENLLFEAGKVLGNRQITTPAAEHGQGRNEHGHRPVAAQVAAPVVDRGEKRVLFQRVR